MYRRRLGVRAAEHSAHTRYELAWGKRLRDVVVCAEVEADDAVRLLPARRQQYDRQRGAAADPATELEAVGAREHDVEDDEIRRLLLEQPAGRVAIVRLERVESLTLEVADH